MQKDMRVFIAGDRTQVPRDLRAMLDVEGYSDIVGCNRDTLDLRNSSEVEDFFANENPEIVFIVAAQRPIDGICKRVPFDVSRDNLMIALNVIHSALLHHAKRIVYISTVSALPWYEDGRSIDEAQLFMGPIEERNEPYSLAKLIGTRLCTYANQQVAKQIFTSVMFPYIYGNIKQSLFYSILHDLMDAQERGLPSVKIWGNPELKYNFLHSRDVAGAAFFVATRAMKYDCYIAGPAAPVSKRDLVSLMAREVGYQGDIVFDSSMPAICSVMASPERLMREGWKPQVSLEEGIRETVAWYRKGGTLA